MGGTVQPSKYVSKQYNGYYYSGWIPLVKREVLSTGGVRAYYEGYIYGGSATQSIEKIIK